MTTPMIAFAAMTVWAAVGFLTARLICGTAWSVQRSPYMSSRADMYSMWVTVGLRALIVFLLVCGFVQPAHAQPGSLLVELCAVTNGGTASCLAPLTATCPYAATAATHGITDDGCSGAPYPAGAIQYPHLLDQYGSNRPPWDVAGVDYYVGKPDDGVPLTDWQTLMTDPDWEWVPQYNLLRYVGTAPLVMDHYDFTTGSVGWSVYTTATTPSISITNSKMGCVPGAGTGVNAPAFGGFNIQSPSAAFVFLNNTVDYSDCEGNGSTTLITVGLQGCTTSDSCSVNFEYNYIKGGRDGPISIGGAQQFVTYKYNLIVDPATGDPACPGGTACAAHMNTLSWAYGNGGTGSNVVVSFNTMFWDNTLTDWVGGEFIQMYWNGGGTFTSPVVSNNTFPANYCCSNNLIHGSTGYLGPPTIVTNGIVSQNYFDPSTSNPFYPGSLHHRRWTVSGNIDMRTGATIRRCCR